MLARIATLATLAAIALVPAAATSASASAAPTGLRGFLLRADEPSVNVFSRTPSFAWNPFFRATSYDFELATSKTFDASGWRSMMKCSSGDCSYWHTRDSTSGASFMPGKR